MQAPKGWNEMVEAAKQKEIYDFMKPCRQGVVSTVSPNGTPEAAFVNLVTMPDLSVIFETLNTTRKYGNLRREPRVALVMGWGGDKTLQIEGRAEELFDSGLGDFKKAYYAALPENSGHEGWPGLTYIRVLPSWIRLSNYGSPWKVEEFDFED
jgi:pyridoxine/pyridoxamine 5'-phosphate oxidase